MPPASRMRPALASAPALVDVDDEDLRAVGGQLAGDAGANSGGPTGNDGYLALVFHQVHDRSLLSATKLSSPLAAVKQFVATPP